MQTVAGSGFIGGYSSPHRYGQQVVAGSGLSTILASMDFEIFSTAGYNWHPAMQRWRPYKQGKSGISAVGAWCYSEHPSTEVLCLVYDLKQGKGRKLWVPGDDREPLDLFEHLASGHFVEAFNSFFEYAIWVNVCQRLYGWPVLHLRSLRDVQAKTLAYTIGGKLERVGEILNCKVQKDKAGGLVMKRLSMARNPTKTNKAYRYTLYDDTDDFQKLFAYCATDVETEDEVSLLCPDLTALETEYFLLDQTINARGVLIDREAVEAAILIIAQAEAKYFAECNAITAGAVPDTNKLPRLKEWVASRGVAGCESITKDTLPEILKRPDLPADVRRVLEIRAIMGSLSVQKTFAMLWTMAADGRIRGLFQYSGAGRTQRWAGMGAQSQNLPASGPEVVECSNCKEVRYVGLWFCLKCFSYESTPTGWGIEAAESCLQTIKTGSLPAVEKTWGDPLTALAGCLRSFFIAAVGCDLISSDFSAIEAVVLAVLAGEEWRLEVFRTHGKIYEMSITKISGVPFEELIEYRKRTGMHHPLRKTLGKIAELASGYQGWINAWKNFGAGDYMTDDEIKRNILLWRDGSPAIVNWWKVLEAASIRAVDYPGTKCPAGPVTFVVHNGALLCWLPSGRYLTYHAPQVVEQMRYGKPKRSLQYWGLSKTKNWVLLDTRGGKLAENIVQAVARDIFAAAMLRVERAGYPVVMHTHDEVTSEILKGFGSIEEYEAILNVRESWFADWPVKVSGGWRGHRYRKD